mgnify:CR=1 FL=1
MANPVVTFEMANGDVIKAELYPEIAPNTVIILSVLSKKKVSTTDLSFIVSSMDL